ncbi:MAG: hypothetical protein NC299_10405 [Lachnospiraceae bacterium]|nr:hypothetical protein [Ruminococcus sp.]MCM1275759.1 hypothetical protein [Lachnospiraceae bacterium]
MTVETHTSANGIKVTVHIPDKEDVPEYIRQQKINQLYDLLAPKADNGNA